MKMETIVIEMPAQTLSTARLRAQARGMTLSEYITEAIERDLAERKASPRGKTASTFTGGVPVSGAAADVRR